MLASLPLQHRRLRDVDVGVAHHRAQDRLDERVAAVMLAAVGQVRRLVHDQIGVETRQDSGHVTGTECPVQTSNHIDSTHGSLLIVFASCT
jgi:hypothetical protein